MGSVIVRTLVACALPALVVAAAWLRVEEPRLAGDALVVVALALVPALFPRVWLRALAALVATGAAAWFAFGVRPWGLPPFRDEHVLGPLSDAVRLGIEDFYGVLLPFDAARNPEMHMLVLSAIFGFVLAAGLLVAARRPLGAAAVTVVGAGWPATLVDGEAVAIGAVALAAALSIPLVLRARSAPSFLVGAVLTGLVVGVAVWASSSTAVAREAALDWEAWDIRGGAVRATSVRFAWDSNYEGIRFPPTKTVVLTVEGPDRARYWRTSTLDLFSNDHWFEDLFWLAQLDEDSETIPLDALSVPRRAQRRESWIEQRVEVKALVDDRLAAAGTPVALDSRQLGTVFLLSGGVLRVRDPLDRGRRYRVWSYAPDPAPAVLARAPARYPKRAARFLEVDGHEFPAFRVPGREEVVRGIFGDASYDYLAPYEPLYEASRRVAGNARTPYAAVLALESWFRQRGGFTYDEQPPRVAGPPLVEFVTRTKAGYCQHYAGAMALMLRMLGIPARVAVGFTSGTFDDGKWVVTDHEAHAWVEVWFPGQGWVPFDPTPGRGTFDGSYSFASASEEAVAALGRGELSPRRVGDELPDSADIIRESASGDGRAPSFAGFAFLVGALWLLVVGGGKAVVRRARYLTRDPRRAATASRRELEAFLRDQGVPVPASATLEDLRRIVGRELGLDGRSFVRAAARARFGPPEEAPRNALAARQELHGLLRRVRLDLSVWSRFRGFVSLRSLYDVRPR